MHGEYKVPGGKLVVVDLEWSTASSESALAGDFFLEPDEALGDINAALDGLPAAPTPSRSPRRSRPPCPPAP